MTFLFCFGCFCCWFQHPGGVGVGGETWLDLSSQPSKIMVKFKKCFLYVRHRRIHFSKWEKITWTRSIIEVLCLFVHLSSAVSQMWEQDILGSWIELFGCPGPAAGHDTATIVTDSGRDVSTGAFPLLACQGAHYSRGLITFWSNSSWRCKINGGNNTLQEKKSLKGSDCKPSLQWWQRLQFQPQTRSWCTLSLQCNLQQ